MVAWNQKAGAVEVVAHLFGWNDECDQNNVGVDEARQR